MIYLKNLKEYVHRNHLAIVGIALTLVLFTSDWLNSSDTLRLAESWRDADSRARETILNGGKAHPIKVADKWAVAFQETVSLSIKIDISVSVVHTKGNSTQSPYP
jgi:hypothetical protein